MSDLSLRDRRDEAEVAAERHQVELDRDTKFYNVNTLARRWGCSRTNVRAIPFDQLPYLNLSRGTKKTLRRYPPENVHAYERSHLQPLSEG